jgi:hypothetical protein
VEVGERFAEGVASAEELSAALEAASELWAPPYGESWTAAEAANTALWGAIFDPASGFPPFYYIATCAALAAAKDASKGIRGRFFADPAYRAYSRAVHSEESEQAALMRCVWGNPYRPASLDPAWLAWKERTIPKLAQAIYEDRDLPSGHLDVSRLGILADALEDAGCSDAGCSDAGLLGHLRGPGPHVRGCWGLDLILGRE